MKIMQHTLTRTSWKYNTVLRLNKVPSITTTKARMRQTAKTKTLGKLATAFHSGSMNRRLTQKTTVLMSSGRIELARSGDRKLRSPTLRDGDVVVADGAPNIRMM